MKWIIGTIIVPVIVVLLILLAGSYATSEGGDSYQAYKNIRAEFPNADIQNMPGTNFIFLVRKENGEVIYVEALDMTNDEITDMIPVFGEMKNDVQKD